MRCPHVLCDWKKTQRDEQAVSVWAAGTLRAERPEPRAAPAGPSSGARGKEEEEEEGGGPPPAYLGAAVQGGLAEGAAAQDADGDVVQLLLFARHAAAAAGTGPARGLAAEVGADGVAVPLVLAQRHGAGSPRLASGSPQRGPAAPSLPQRGPAGSILAPAADPEPLRPQP